MTGMSPAKVGHPDWCGESCDVFREGGRHRGEVVRVDGPKGRRIATVWREQVGDGPSWVGVAVGPTLSPEDALRVAKAIETVAGSVGVRVG